MLKLKFSPCPNDTFLFYGLLRQDLAADCANFEVEMLDIEQLNESALNSDPDICKVSYHTLGKILDRYISLPVGAALGFDNGQKLVAKTPFDLSELSGKRIAIPGLSTTANFLYRLLLPAARSEVPCLYHEVPEKVLSGEVDCGIILHETRFNFEALGLQEIVDFGKMWQMQHKCPLPLGCIAVKRSLGERVIASIRGAISTSLEVAKTRPSDLMEFMRNYSIEKDPSIIQAHIDLFVNSETEALSSEGISAVNKMFALGRIAGLLPETDKAWLCGEEGVG